MKFLFIILTVGFSNFIFAQGKNNYGFVLTFRNNFSSDSLFISINKSELQLRVLQTDKLNGKTGFYIVGEKKSKANYEIEWLNGMYLFRGKVLRLQGKLNNIKFDYSFKISNGRFFVANKENTGVLSIVQSKNLFQSD